AARSELCPAERRILADCRVFQASVQRAHQRDPACVRLELETCQRTPMHLLGLGITQLRWKLASREPVGAANDTMNAASQPLLPVITLLFELSRGIGCAVTANMLPVYGDPLTNVDTLFASRNGSIEKDDQRRRRALRSKLLGHRKGNQPAEGESPQQIRPLRKHAPHLFDVKRRHGIDAGLFCPWL